MEWQCIERSVMLLGVTGNTGGSEPSILGSNPREAAGRIVGTLHTVRNPPCENTLACVAQRQEARDLGSRQCQFESDHKYELVVHTLNYPACPRPINIR